MSNPRYPEEFKIQAVNQVTEKKLPVADVAARLGVSTHSSYTWVKAVTLTNRETGQRVARSQKRDFAAASPNTMLGRRARHIKKSSAVLH